MREAWRLALGAVLVFMTVGLAAAARSPQAPPAGRGRSRRFRRDHGRMSARPIATASIRRPPTAAGIYAAECVTCHGPSARGTERGANLVRSQIVLRDRYGNAIGPLLKKGHPMQTSAPSSSLTDAQTTDLSHFIWQRINDTLRGSPAFEAGDVLVGDAKAGEAYFNGEGRCATCHSPAGDLAGYGKRFPPIEIQQRFVFPNTTGGRGRGRAAGPSRQQVTVTVTLPDGTSVSGPLVSVDDFHVALRDSTGAYRSWTRTPAMKVVKNDPLSAHVELLDRLSDKQMHDVVAYLETLK